LNERDKCLRVRNLLKGWKVDIVYFQETKLKVVSRNVVVGCGVAIMWNGVVCIPKGLRWCFTYVG
jgi:hypothetical protein